jgi:hypothetical protein
MIKHRDGVMAGSEKNFDSFTLYHFTFADYIQIFSEPRSELADRCTALIPFSDYILLVVVAMSVE